MPRCNLGSFAATRQQAAARTYFAFYLAFHLYLTHIYNTFIYIYYVYIHIYMCVYIYGCSSQCKVPIHTLGPLAIHTPWPIPMIHTPLEDMIHTYDILWSIPMIHTSVIANPGHVLVLFLSCTYGILQFLFHALRFEWGVRASYLMHVI